MLEVCEHILLHWGEPVIFTAASFVVYIAVFWGHHLWLHSVVYSGCIKSLHRYKVTEKEPPPELTREALMSEAAGAVLQLPVLYFIFRWLLEGVMTISCELPSLPHLVLRVAVWHAIFDAWFYWGHRLLHSPALYWIHKQHHRFYSSVGIAATFAHPVEAVLIGLGSTFAGPVLFPRTHMLVWLVYFALRLHETVDAHSGYDFPWSPWRYMPLHGGCRRHDFHHSHNKGNYGGFWVWDWLCGTDEAYLKFLAQRGGSGKAD